MIFRLRCSRWPGLRWRLLRLLRRLCLLSRRLLLLRLPTGEAPSVIAALTLLRGLGRLGCRLCCGLGRLRLRWSVRDRLVKQLTIGDDDFFSIATTCINGVWSYHGSPSCRIVADLRNAQCRLSGAMRVERATRTPDRVVVRDDYLLKICRQSAGSK